MVVVIVLEGTRLPSFSRAAPQNCQVTHWDGIQCLMPQKSQVRTRRTVETAQAPFNWPPSRPSKLDASWHLHGKIDQLKFGEQFTNVMSQDVDKLRSSIDPAVISTSSPRVRGERLHYRW